jgi:hypothetical protein
MGGLAVANLEPGAPPTCPETAVSCLVTDGQPVLITWPDHTTSYRDGCALDGIVMAPRDDTGEWVEVEGRPDDYLTCDGA